LILLFGREDLYKRNTHWKYRSHPFKILIFYY